MAKEKRMTVYILIRGEVVVVICRQREIDLKNEKERRRQGREERRKAKILAKLKLKDSDEINNKIIKEEKKLLKVQRKLESIRLVEELFKRINNKKGQSSNYVPHLYTDENEIMKLKNISELEVQKQKEKLHRTIQGRVVLKSILGGRSRGRSGSSDSSKSNSSKKRMGSKSPEVNKPVDANCQHDIMYGMADPNWYGYAPSNNVYHLGAPYGSLRGNPSGCYPYFPRGRGFIKGPVAGPSRGFYSSARRPRGGFNQRSRGGYYGRNVYQYPPEVEEEYYKYFQKFLHEDKQSNRDDRSYRSYSRSRSRSYSRRRSRCRSRSYRRSYSRSRRSYSRSHSRNRRSRSRSRRSYYSRRSRQRSAKRSTSRRSSKCKNRSKSKCRSRSGDKNKSRSPSYRSIDSSKFISPSRLRHPRSKSWSLPKDIRKSRRARSWSRTPEPKK